VPAIAVDRSREGHARAARSFAGHTGSPAPILAALHPGAPQQHSQIIRGDLASREFVAFWLDEANRIKAVMNVNIWDVIDAVKPLIRDGIAVEPAKLSDPQVAYSELAAEL
jgi:Reductase C-terminal